MRGPLAVVCVEDAARGAVPLVSGDEDARFKGGGLKLPLLDEAAP